METKKLTFRTLRAEEIDCRIATVSAKGITLLLYKDARVDQNILDETVGPMNWQRSHSRENANCTVSLWDEEKRQWISKEDTGKESYTEAEKGLASDSFKRACFNWGIGRELYTAPFIWIPAESCTIKDSGRTDKYGKPIKACSDRFRVARIGYDTDRNINDLSIKNQTGKIVFDMKGIPAPQKESGKAQSIGQAHIAAIQSELKRTGLEERRILNHYRIRSFSQMTIDQFRDCMDEFKKCPNYIPPAEVPAEGEAGLPWK